MACSPCLSLYSGRTNTMLVSCVSLGMIPCAEVMNSEWQTERGVHVSLLSDYTWQIEEKRPMHIGRIVQYP